MRSGVYPARLLGPSWLATISRMWLDGRPSSRSLPRLVFAVIDVSNPVGPSGLSYLEIESQFSDETANITVAGGWALVDNVIFDVNVPAHPVRRGTAQVPSPVRDAQANGQDLYVLTREAGMHIQHLVNLPCTYTWLPLVIRQ
jgi:hypothetical protein